MNGDQIVSMMAIGAALVLAIRGLRGRQVPPGKRLTMIVIWVVIIIGMVFTLYSLDLGGAQ